MRDPNRIDEILDLVGQVWKQTPDLRLCQLLANLYPYEFYTVEDATLKLRLENLVRQNKERAEQAERKINKDKPAKTEAEQFIDSFIEQVEAFRKLFR